MTDEWMRPPLPQPKLGWRRLVRAFATAAFGVWLLPMVMAGVLGLMLFTGEVLFNVVSLIDDMALDFVGGDKDFGVFGRLLALQMVVVAFCLPLMLFVSCWVAGSLPFAFNAAWACPVLYLATYALLLTRSVFDDVPWYRLFMFGVPTLLAAAGGFLGDGRRCRRSDADREGALRPERRPPRPSHGGGKRVSMPPSELWAGRIVRVLLTGVLATWFGPFVLLAVLTFGLGLAMGSLGLFCELPGWLPWPVHKDNGVVYSFTWFVMGYVNFTAFGLTLPVFTSCWCVGSRRYAIRARLVCPAFFVVTYGAAWLSTGQPGLKGRDLHMGVLALLIPALGAFFGGWLGDRSRQRRAASGGGYLAARRT